MTDPQGAILTRDTVTGPMRLRLWWNGKDEQPSVTLSKAAALNLAIDLLLSLRHEDDRAARISGVQK